MNDEWRTRWRDGRIGFHEDQPNALLDRHVARLAGRRRVLVPLCGRAEDMAFLAAHGHQVVGVELVEDAVREFFELHALVPSVVARGPLVEYSAGALTVLAGDLFETTPAHVGAIDAFYDRAALIALPAELRRRYVAHLRTLVPPGSPGLVIILEHDASRSGPPYVVGEAELRALYAGSEVEWLEDRASKLSASASHPEAHATERCFAIGLDDARS